VPLSAAFVPPIDAPSPARTGSFARACSRRTTLATRIAGAIRNVLPAPSIKLTGILASALTTTASLAATLLPARLLPGRLLAVRLLGATLLTGIMVAVTMLAALPGQAHAEPSGSDLETKIEDASRRLETVVEQYDGLREDLKATKSKFAVLAKTVAPLEREVNAHRDRVGVLAATAYRTGGIGVATALLGARSGSEVTDQLLFLYQLAHYQQGEIAGLRAVEQRYDTARHSLEALAATQSGQERQLAAKKTMIEAEITQLEQMRDHASEANLTGAAADRAANQYGYVPQQVPGAAGDVVKFAYAQIGKPYRWAAEGPNAYDCSGLVTAAYRKAGVQLPHNSRQQWRSVTPISRSQLRPGDVVFYYPDVHHVGIYMGNGMMVHAPTYGEPVRMDRIDQQPIYGFGRVS
jgi:cell wall-associated NlpC family hydrolase